MNKITLMMLTFITLTMLTLASCTKDEEESSTPISAYNTWNTNSPLAVNIAPFAAWTPGWVLIDLFPKTQQWVSNLCDSDDWESGPDLSLDSKGWVTSLSDNQCADTSVLASQAGHYPVGTYVLLWEGSGTLTARWDVEPPISSASATVETTAAGLNRMTFDISLDQQTDLGIGLRISELGSDPISNIRLIPPGGMCGTSATELDYFQYCQSARGGTGSCTEGNSCFDFEDIYWDRFSDSTADMNNPKPVFHPLYADSYKQYRAVRYMKWSRAEDSHAEDWTDRVTVDEQSFTDEERGMPYEYMISLSNLLNAHMYLALPMKSTDAYQSSAASLINSTLNANLKIFLEYGNEIFNSVQPLPHSYAIEQAEAQLSMSSESDFVKSGSWAGYRSAQIFDIWKDEFASNLDRFVGVLVGFNPIAEYTNAVLDYNNAYQSADALAINGYIGPSRPYVDDTSAFDAMSVDNIITEINDGSVIGSGSSITDLNSIYTSHATLASSKGLTLLAYEGGNFMELDGAPQSTIDNFYTMNRDTRLGEAFVQNIQNFIAAGGQEFFFFLNEDLWTDEGAFGARRYQDEGREEAVVFDSLMDYIEANACSWDNCQIAAP